MISLTLLIRVTTVLSLGVLASLLLPRQQAALRHAVCVVCALLASLLPAAALLPAVAVPAPFVFSAQASTLTERIGPPLPLGELWLLGTLVVLARFLAGAGYLAYLTRRGEHIDSPARHMQGPIVLADVKTPLVWGWFRPVILLPRSAAAWDRERWELSLLHERIHILRGDVWTSTFGLMTEALYWFHPLAWLLTARMRQEQELACDARVLAMGSERVRYAELLVQTVGEQIHPGLLGCRMTGGAMKRRVERVLAFRCKPEWAWQKRAAAVTLCALALLRGALLAPAAEDGPYKIGGDVSAPKLIHKQEPKYTRAARRDKVSGVVVLSMVVSAEGRPKDIAVLKSLRPDLDKQAMKAVSTWKFQPAQKENHPVAVKANVEVQFRLL